MATIPAESRAYIKPFEGTDIVCLLIDCVEWFDVDGVSSVLNLNVCHALKQLPRSQKALWKELEPEVHSEKQFITSLGVRLLIAKTQQECEIVSRRRSRSCSPVKPSPCTYYYNTPVDDDAGPSCGRKRRRSSRHHHHHYPKFEISHAMHNFGNIFINEAVYDLRAYCELEEIDQKINRIYDLVVQQNQNNNPVTVV
ncbi:pep1 [Spodoptera frugiperda granulovirus]|uniref:Pep-1 n=1 Tax=Spodoptera frugiperda granulovirus TaxID=307454 RepID=A0A068FTD5_9BBAC|nr:pep1 [Spodoptera frugiperda granulovirus]AID68453.1 pep1 [Spodoptera frugiperda granulovirus]AJK91677.1 pep1 [Spodoptera frugiperda granulovirus]AXS01035.1 pep-1 [Spodoptera frugiperda granulovirus]